MVRNFFLCKDNEHTIDSCVKCTYMLGLAPCPFNTSIKKLPILKYKTAKWLRAMWARYLSFEIAIRFEAFKK